MQTPVSIRLNPFKGCKGPEGLPVPWNRYGRILSQRPAFTLDPLLHAGCYYVQDSSAMFPGHILRKHLPRRAGLKVLDLCAAPGGKTTDAAASLRELFGDDFTLVSNEVNRSRVRILSDNTAIWGDPRVAVTNADPSHIGRVAEGFFDVILADVPCSGEGMFRKDERARQQWSPELVVMCRERQKKILSDVWPALKPGGLLVYSTCTYEDAENDSNLEWAARELGGEILPPVVEFAHCGVEKTRCGNLLRDGVSLGEGQWAGALLKNGSGSVSRRGDELISELRPVRASLVKGETKGGKFIPSADYALSLAYRKGEYPEAELDLKTALHFLHRDTIVLPDAPRGFVAVCYRGCRLGFVNNLGARCNNLHPLSRRILMNIE